MTPSWSLTIPTPPSVNAMRQTLMLTRIVLNPETGCWLWERARTPFGHGIIRLFGKNIVASRLSYEAFIGQIPKGMYVLHKCDIPACVRPEHLFLGTKADNSADMVSKGRAHRGEDRPESVLTSDLVRQIFIASGSQASIAQNFGVCQTTVSVIKRRVQWKHITCDL